MKKEFKPMKNTKNEKIFFTVMTFLLVNLIGIINSSTNYVNGVIKNNPKITKELLKIFGEPLLRGSKNYYLFKFSWIKIMALSPKLTSNFIKTIVIFFIISLFSLLFLVKRQTKTSQGSARWGDYDDLKQSKDTKEKLADMDFLTNDGFVIGEVGKKLLHENSNTHVALVIPTRGGKGIGYIIPSLVEGVKNSTLVNDIKKENYEKSAYYRAKAMKHKVYKFEPMCDLSNKFNPLLEIYYETDKEIEHCRAMGATIVGEDKSSDPFWGLEAQNIISTMIMYVHYKFKEEKLGIPTLTDAVKLITDPNYSVQELARKYLGINEDGEELEEEELDFQLSEELKEKLKKIYLNTQDIEIINKGRHPFLINQFSYIKNMSENTLKSIVATAKSKLSVFELPTVAKNLINSDFRIIDLMNDNVPVDLFLVVKPKDIDLLAPLVRIVITQINDILTENLNGKKNKLTMILDEFPAIGKMRKIETGLGFYAGYKIKVVLIFQGLDQLQKIYGKENGILSGCQTQIFGRPNDNESAKFISETLGSTTIVNKSKSVNSGLKGGGSVSISEGKRELLTVGEVKRLPQKKAVTITGIKPPLLLDKVVYFKRPDLLERTNHQPVFHKKGYVIFEAREGEKDIYSIITEEEFNKLEYGKLPEKMEEEEVLKRINELEEIENRNIVKKIENKEVKEQKRKNIKRKEIEIEEMYDSFEDLMAGSEEREGDE